MKRRCFLRITKPTVLSVEVPRTAARTPVGASDPGINAKEGAFHPPPHMYGTPHASHRLPRLPCQAGGHLVSSRGSRGQEAAFCPCSAPKPQGSVRRTETPSVYEEPRQLCLAEHSPAVLMPAPGEHSPPPGLTLSHSWGQPGWAAWAEVSPHARRSAATRNANCSILPLKGRRGGMVTPKSRAAPGSWPTGRRRLGWPPGDER